MEIKKEDFVFIIIVHPFSVAYFYLGCLLVIYWFFYFYFSGHRRGSGLKVTVSVQDKRKTRTQYQGETERLFDYNKWHNITVRFQNSESLIRIFVGGKMVLAKEFKGFDIFADNAQLRLAQVYEVEAENIGAIKHRFKVGRLQEKKICCKERFLTSLWGTPKRVTITPQLPCPSQSCPGRSLS